MLLLAEHAGLFSGIDNYFYDLSFRFRGESKPSDRIGHIHIGSGIDGIVREICHTLYYRNLLLPSLSAVVCETVTGATFQRIQYPRDVLSAGAIVQSDTLPDRFFRPMVDNT